MKKAVKIFIGAAVLIVIYIAANAVSICTFGMRDEKCISDAAIILGAAAYGEEVSPVYQERLNHAVTLYNEGYAEKLIVTGGVGKGQNNSDAYAAKKYLISQGIPTEDILTEDTSTITQENLINSKKIMDEKGYKSAIIVSDPLHMKRSLLLAKDAGITAFSYPTPTSKYVSLKTKAPFLLREVYYYIGYKWHRSFK